VVYQILRLFYGAAPNYLATGFTRLEMNIGTINRLEALKGDRKGQYSIRINDRWRICFEWHDGHAENVEIADHHKG